MMTTEKFYEIAKQTAKNYEQIEIVLHKEYTLAVSVYGTKTVMSFAGDNKENVKCGTIGPLNGLSQEQKMEIIDFAKAIEKAAAEYTSQSIRKEDAEIGLDMDYILVTGENPEFRPKDWGMHDLEWYTHKKEYIEYCTEGEYTLPIESR